MQMYPPSNNPHPLGEGQMCAVSVWKFSCNLQNEITNPHPCSQERSLKKLLAFLIMIHWKISQCLQKAYYLGYSQQITVLIYTTLTMLKKYSWLASGHTPGTGQNALHTFSRGSSQQELMGEETKAKRDWITRPSLHNREVEETDLSSSLADTRAYGLNF